MSVFGLAAVVAAEHAAAVASGLALISFEPVLAVVSGFVAAVASRPVASGLALSVFEPVLASALVFGLAAFLPVRWSGCSIPPMTG